MHELPLFPLNTVLFPGMPLPLHIFEDRYKQMIRLCLDEERPFGVVFIRRSTTVAGPLATPHSVGCTARIIQVQPLEEERMLVMTVGQERFRIVSLQYDRPYLVGKVEMTPLDDELTPAAGRAAERLYPLVVEYLEILSQIGEVEFDTTQLPDDPQQLAFLAAGFLQLPEEKKQPLLEVNDIAALSRELYTMYRRELSLMRTMPREDRGVFSLN
jgi:Lon protease-like protein